MKVLIITKTRTGGGTEGHINSTIPALRKRGIDMEAAYTEDGFWQLYRRIYDGRPDIVHFFLPRPYLLGSLACDLAFHHCRIMSRRSLTGCYQTRWIRWIERLLHKRTQILVGNSPAVVEQLREEAPTADIRLIRNGVIINPLFTFAYGTLFTMIYVANAFKYKGHEDLIDAVKRIAPGLPEPWQLLLVGRGTERFKGWRVKGLGYRTDTPILLACSELFILPSHEEGCSNALLEAMAGGIPVIATDVGGNKDAVIHGETGLLVPPKDPTALAEAIIWMAKDPEFRKQCAQKSLALVKERFSFDRCVDEYEALYRSALKGA